MLQTAEQEVDTMMFDVAKYSDDEVSRYILVTRLASTSFFRIPSEKVNNSEQRATLNGIEKN